MSLPSFPLAAMAVLLVCTQASGQTDPLPGFDLERLQMNVGRGTLLMGNGELMVPGGLSVNILGHYQRLPLTLNDGVQNLEVVRNRVTTLLAASYGVLPWLEVGGQVPLILWQDGDNPEDAGLARLSAQGLGTPTLHARLGLMSRQRRQPVDLAGDLAVGLPLGTGQALASDNGPRFLARLTAGTTLGWFQTALEAGVLFRPTILLPTAQGVPEPGASSEIQIGASLSTTGKAQRGELAVRTIIGPQVSLEVLGGIRFPLLAGLDAFIQGGPGLSGAIGTPRFRMLAGVTFRSEPPPKLTFLNENEDRELQLALAEQTAPVEEKKVRPVSTWELNSVIKGKAEEEEKQAREPARPHQVQPHEKLVLRGQILFAAGSAEVPSVVPLLDQAVQRFLEQARSGTILIEGHADHESSEWSNTVMSVRRAQAVRRYLIDQGIPGKKVRIRGFGSDWPVSTRPATEQERQLNRRAEILVLTEAEEESTAP